MAILFGVLGAIVAVLYVIRVDPSHLPANVTWLTWMPEILIYAAAGFVIGWVIGFAFSRIGHD